MDDQITPEPAQQPLAVEAGASLPNRHPARFVVGQRVRIIEHSALRDDVTNTGVVTHIDPAQTCPDGAPLPPMAYVRLDESYVSTWTGETVTNRVILLTDDLTAGLYDHLAIEPIGDAPAREAWHAEADDITGPVSRVVLTHPILGRLTSEPHPSPASANDQAALLRTDLAGQGWTVEVTA